MTKIQKIEEESFSIDPVSYFTELIIQISKNLTKGRGLSKRGVNAFFLFLLTGSLLYVNTIMPTNFINILKLYYIPIIFLIYFIYDITKNIQKLDRFWRRIFQKTDFGYNNIINGNISLGDLEFYISTLSFTREQIEHIILNMQDSDQFTPNIQNGLLHNKNIYRVDTLPLIKESLINFNWTSSAICTFLRFTRRNLSPEYLDKLIDKYGENPSILFAIGHFHNYNIHNLSFYKMGNEFKCFKDLYNKVFTYTILFFIGINLLLMLIFLIYYEYRIFILGLTILTFVLYLLIFRFIKILTNKIFTFIITRHIKKYDCVDDNNIINKLIDDLIIAFLE